MAPERVTAYELDGDSVPWTGARTRIRIVLVIVFIGDIISDVDVVIYGDRRFGRWWTRRIL